MVFQFLANGVMVGGIYALIALGIVLIYKSTGIFNFAAGDLMMMGGFIAWVFMKHGVPPLLAIILAMGVGALIGLIIERVTLRPLIGQPILAPLMVTLSISFLLKGLALLIWSGYPQIFPRFLPGKLVKLGPVPFSHELLWTFGVVMFIYALFLLFYRYSRVGLLMRAAAEDHQLAQSKGISVKNIFSITWLIAGMTAVVGGVFLGVKLSLTLSLADVGLKAFAAVLLGGLESIAGALIGGIITGVFENLVGGLINPTLMEISPYILVLIVLIFKTEGLFGLKRIERI